MSTNPIGELMNRAYDEARPVTSQLELTYKCNLLCSFCYNAPREVRELDGDEWLRVLDLLQAAGTFTVILTGGEPMVHRDFWRIAEGVRERGLVLKAYTNGVLLADRSKAERWAALAPFDTEVSLHGSTAQVHDRLTGIRGSFDKLMVALGHARDLGVKISLKTPITRLNQHQLHDIDALAARFGFTVTYDTNILPTDEGDTSTLSLAADKALMVDFLVGQVQRGRRGINPRPVDKLKQNCGTGRSTVTIDPYGEIFPCVAWRRSLGNVRKVDDLLALWHGKDGELNDNLRYVREAADQVPRRTLSDSPEGAFASFCPAAAEKETGSPFTFYDVARASGKVKLEVYERTRGANEDEKAERSPLARKAGTA
jgi:MoaA/NifB/PqqE/SkfB family radical SAM enzyme